MGNRLSSLTPTSNSSHSGRAEKRKRDSEDVVADYEVEDVSPQRKRILTTSDYIFETLYKQGADSDVTINALGM